MQDQSNRGGSKAEAKIGRPHKEFEHPTEVVADPTLTKSEKITALDQLEQDARQLATASGEGMSGGEGNELREVLLARKVLTLPPADVAIAVVLQRFETRLAEAEGTDAHTVIGRAIDAIKAAVEAIDGMEAAAVPPAGAPKPGSEQELQDELAKEKLDP